MSKKIDNPADPFKKALGDATRALAGDEEIEVTYSADPPGRTNAGMRLPQVSRRMTRSEVELARGTADAYALRERFHVVPRQILRRQDPREHGAVVAREDQAMRDRA